MNKTKAIIVMVIIGIVAVVVQSFSNDNTKAAAQAQYEALTPAQKHVIDSTKQADEEAKSGRYANELKMFDGIARLKEALKDPDSFIDMGHFVSPNGAGSCLAYRAKNSFGAYNGKTYAVFAPNGLIYTPEEDDAAFRSAWKKYCVYHTPEEIAHQKHLVDEEVARQVANRKQYAFEHPKFGPYMRDGNTQNGNMWYWSSDCAEYKGNGITPIYFPNKEVAEKQGYVYLECH